MTPISFVKIDTNIFCLLINYLFLVWKLNSTKNFSIILFQLTRGTVSAPLHRNDDRETTCLDNNFRNAKCVRHRLCPISFCLYCLVAWLVQLIGITYRVCRESFTIYRIKVPLHASQLIDLWHQIQRRSFLYLKILIKTNSQASNRFWRLDWLYRTG